MGTIFAPWYANIFMDHFERKSIYPFIKTFSLIYLWLIDDIFFIWKGRKTDLEKFLNKLNTKHPAIKFEYEISKERISFLDTEIYIKNKKLHIKIFRKKKEYHSRELKERFWKKGYDQKLADEQLEKVDKLARDDLLQEKDQEQQDPERTPLILTYNRFLTNLTAVACKNWNILQTSKNLWELFQEHPITSFNRNKNLKEIIGGTRIENGKVNKFNIPSRTEKCTPCLSGARTLCCNQVLTTNTVMSQHTKRTLIIFFNVNCKSEYVIYLMDCILCKMQYVRKV